MEDNHLSDFFITMSNQICALKKSGLIFDLTHFSIPEKDQIIITVVGKKTKTFDLSCEKKSFFLNNPEEKKPGGRPTFMLEDMVTYLLILVNGGPVPGLLLMPGSENLHLEHCRSVVPT